MTAGPTHQIAIAFRTPGARARASSSLRIACSMSERPAPPYSLGHEAPTKPAAWSVRCQARSAAARRHRRLPPRALPLAILLSARGPNLLRPRRTGPGTDHRGTRTNRPRDRRRRHRPGVRAARRRRLPQYRRDPRRRREPPRALPEDAHSRRPALLREVLLHAGRPRLPGVRHRTRADRRARLLRPLVL